MQQKLQKKILNENEKLTFMYLPKKKKQKAWFYIIVFFFIPFVNTPIDKLYSVKLI